MAHLLGVSAPDWKEVTKNFLRRFATQAVPQDIGWKGGHNHPHRACACWQAWKSHLSWTKWVCGNMLTGPPHTDIVHVFEETSKFITWLETSKVFWNSKTLIAVFPTLFYATTHIFDKNRFGTLHHLVLLNVSWSCWNWRMGFNFVWESRIRSKPGSWWVDCWWCKNSVHM